MPQERAGTPQNWERKQMTPCAAFMNVPVDFWNLIILKTEQIWELRMMAVYILNADVL